MQGGRPNVSRVLQTLSLLQTSAKYGKGIQKKKVQVRTLQDLCYDYMGRHPDLFESKTFNPPQDICHSLLNRLVQKKTLNYNNLALLLSADAIKRIEELSLRGRANNGVDLDSLTLIAKGMPNLAFLDISYCVRVTSETIEAICLYAKKLEILYCERCLAMKEKMHIKSQSLSQVKLNVCTNLNECIVECPNLEAINFHSCTDLHILTWISQATKLRQLGLLNCSKINAHCLTQVLSSGCKSIIVLNLFGLSQLQSGNISKICSTVGVMEHLDELNLFNCYNISNEDLEAIINSSPNLRILFLNHCEKITNDAAIKLKLLTKLESLSLPRTLGDDSVVHIVKECTKLFNIDLTDNLYITNNTVHAIFENCLNMGALSLCECQDITAEAFNILDHGDNTLDSQMKTNSKNESIGVKIQNLNLTSLPINDKTLTIISSRCKLLSEIDLHGCVVITDKGLISLIINLKSNLKRLALDNTLVSDATLEQIAIYCDNLEALDLYGCTNITIEGVIKIINQCHNLARLELSLKLGDRANEYLTKMIEPSKVSISCRRSVDI